MDRQMGMQMLDHRVKIVRIVSYSHPHFSAFGLNTFSPYLVRMRENADENNSE